VACLSSSPRPTYPGRLTRCIYIPQEETGLYLFTAESADAVRAVAASCGLTFERVVEALSDWHTAGD